jgi:hypothetical protein
MNFSVTKTLLALGCAGTLAATASAQLPASYTQGDFLLGFRQVGNTNSVVVDLGPISSFSGTLDFSIDLGSTLSNQFGSGWASDPAVFFSLASTDSGNNTSYVTSPEYLTGPSAGAAKVWNRLTNTNANIFQGKINNLGDEFSSAGSVESKTDVNAYSNFMPGGATDSGHATSAQIAWGYFNPTTEGNFGQTTAGVELDTIQLAPGAGKGTEEGDFTISPDGNTLTFTPLGEVPEPSSFAAMAVIGALALLGFQMQKTRKSVKRQSA